WDVILSDMRSGLDLQLRLRIPPQDTEMEKLSAPNEVALCGLPIGEPETVYDAPHRESRLQVPRDSRLYACRSMPSASGTRERGQICSELRNSLTIVRRPRPAPGVWRWRPVYSCPGAPWACPCRTARRPRRCPERPTLRARRASPASSWSSAAPPG